MMICLPMLRARVRPQDNAPGTLFPLGLLRAEQAWIENADDCMNVTDGLRHHDRVLPMPAHAIVIEKHDLGWRYADGSPWFTDLWEGVGWEIEPIDFPKAVDSFDTPAVPA